MSKRSWVYVAIGAIVLFVFWRWKCAQSDGSGSDGGSTVGMSSQTLAS